MQHKVFILVVKGDYIRGGSFLSMLRLFDLVQYLTVTFQTPWLEYFISRQDEIMSRRLSTYVDVAATDREGQVGKGWQSKCVRCAQRCTSTVQSDCSSANRLGAECIFVVPPSNFFQWTPVLDELQRSSFVFWPQEEPYQVIRGPVSVAAHIM